MNNLTKIVTLIPSATEIVAFLGQKNSIIGRSHECDYPRGLNHIAKLTSPKINVDGTSRQIDEQINTILENSLSVYKVDVKKLKELNPDYIITQAHCEVCAVSFSEVESIVNKNLNKNTKIISLQPNTLNDVFNDIKKVAIELNLENEINKKLINNLDARLRKIKEMSSKQKIKPAVACIEWIDPLMVAGNWIPEMVEIAGGKNILGKSGNDSHWIKFIDILNQDPEIIIFLPCGFNIKKTKEELKNFLKENDNWKSLNAFKNKKIFIADGNQFFNRPGPRLLESLEIFAEIMHPNLFNFGHEGSGWINYND
ncbi:cobalamin-binding protein [Pelagibacteraceae bacterium]|jgi:iron complex transport system substrate-binding protein|nr:cobalamin-binding protein [Pelagibacteraceae bacterium]